MPGDADAEQFTEANRAYFDDLASRYNAKPWQQKMSAKIMAEIRAKAAFIGVTEKADGASEKQVRLLDYACGTGLVSKALAPYITSTTGIDISTSMIAAFKAAFTPSDAAREPPPAFSAHVGDLLSTPPTASLSGPAFSDFDIAAVGLGFHHFADPGEAAKRLAARLKVGGVLLVVDFCAHGKGHGEWVSHHHDHAHAHSTEHTSSHEQAQTQTAPWTHTKAAHTVRTHGFTQHETRALFEAAGLRDFGWSEVAELLEMRFPSKDAPVDENGGEQAERVVWQRVFLARGTRVS